VIDDELYPDAKKLVLTAGYASTSLLQRNFRIGYTRAVYLIDQLERDGIVGPANGPHARPVLPAPKSGDLFA
jgi:S-DNA-T family DNA segregation ATPase FtsK/SpoIIIE